MPKIVDISRPPASAQPVAMPAAPAQSATMPPDLRALAARLKGRTSTPENQVVVVPESEAFPISVILVKEQALGDARIGQLITGKGIFIGQEERQGRKYNWFAAPGDLTDASGVKFLGTYNDTAKELASRKNWHGYDGGDCKNETGLYAGLENGSLIGKWVIPPRHILQGKDVDGNEVRADNNLYALKNAGDFKKPAHAFTTASVSGVAHWYWSCTEPRKHLTNNVYIAVFTDGSDVWHLKDDLSLSCRPCRVELAL